MRRCTLYSWAFVFAAVVATLLLAVASDSPAQARAREQPTEDQLDEAKIHFKAGKLYYEKEKFAKAIIEFEAGYELVKKPAFLVNIAQCYRKLGEIVKARDHYARYIEEDPQSPQISQVEKIISELDTEIKMAEAAGGLAAADEGDDTAAAVGKKPRPPAPVEEPVEQAVEDEPQPVPAAALPRSDPDEVAARRRRRNKGKDEDPPFYSRAWFWTLIGITLVGGGAAGVYLTTIKKDFVTDGTLGKIDATTK